MSQHHESLKNYFLVYFVLMALLVVTVWVAHINLSPFNAALAMFIASIKTLLVLGIFMHLRKAGWLLWSGAIVGFFFLAILLGFTFSDYFTRN